LRRRWDRMCEISDAKARGVYRGRKASIDAAKVKALKADGVGLLQSPGFSRLAVLPSIALLRLRAIMLVQTTTAALIVAVLIGSRASSCFRSYRWSAHSTSAADTRPNVRAAEAISQPSPPAVARISCCAPAHRSRRHPSEQSASGAPGPYASADFRNPCQNRLQKWGLKLRLLLDRSGFVSTPTAGLSSRARPSVKVRYEPQSGLCSYKGQRRIFAKGRHSLTMTPP